MATTIKVIDSVMGSGKTSAMINMINESPSDIRFIFVTPYLDEVERISKSITAHKKVCAPKNDKRFGPKLAQLKRMVENYENIVTTHALYLMFDAEVLELLKARRYTLIVDEALDEFGADGYNAVDYDAAMQLGAICEKDGLIHWTGDYKGCAFDSLKERCPAKAILFGNRYVLIPPIRQQLCETFDDIYIMTYMFKAQPLWGLYTIMGFRFEYYYATKENGRHAIKKGEPKLGGERYRGLISLYDGSLYRCHQYEYGNTPLSFTRLQSKCTDEEFDEMRRSLGNFFRNVCKAKSAENLWTTFHDFEAKLSDGGYAKGFAPVNSKATNKYGDKHNVAYVADRYINPFLKRFFEENGIANFNQDAYALSSMLQFIWRSAIRNDEPINLFVPSRRMRTLLVQWLNGASSIEQIQYSFLMYDPELLPT